MSDLKNEINEECNKAYKWAVKSLVQTDPAICYEYGVRAGMCLGFKKAVEMLRAYKDDDGFAQAPYWADWLEEQIK